MDKLTTPVMDASFLASSPENFRGWQKAVSGLFLPLQLSPRVPAAFRGRVRAAGRDCLQLAEVTATGHTIERTRDLITESSSEYFKLSVQLSGSGVMIQGDRQITLEPGDMTIYDTGRPYSLVFEEDFRFLVALFPQQAVQFRRKDVEELAAIRMDGSGGVGSMVSSFLTSLSTNLEGLAAPTGARLSQIGLELIATLVDDQLGELQTTSTTALKRQIYTYMSDHLGDPDLSPSSIADANFISVRYLHSLFREEGTTVAAWIRAQRLERCRQELRDPTQAHLSVSEIAARWGMPDAGHFSKLFRTHYQQTPSAWRTGRPG